ncbi:MAG: DUF3352 domain-containing protein [Phycisphaerales bacterium]|nr:MAG: DUF3352 domain-containing protein [Phycisphaerales bacterium]
MKPDERKNRRFSTTLLSLLFCVIISAIAPAAAQALTLPDTAKLLPPETVLLVDIGDFTRLRGQFEKTSLFGLYKDPALQPFLDDFNEKAREKIRESDNEFLAMLLDGETLPKGRLALAIVLNEKTKDANDPPFLLIAQWGSEFPKFKDIWDRMMKKSVEDGARQKTEDYRGVSITTVIDESSSPVSGCFIEDCLIVSPEPDVLRFAIAHVKGAGSPALASDSDYVEAQRATGPHHDIDLYVNIKQIIKIAAAEDETGEAKTTLQNLGLDNVAAFNCSVALARDPGNCSSAKALLKINGAKKGICKILDFEPTRFAPPAFVPASAYSMTFINVNIKKAFDELSSILYKFSPQMAALLFMPLVPQSPQGEPAIQLKADIIDHMGSQIIIAQSLNKKVSEADAASPPESLFALAVTNRSALEKSLGAVHARMTQNNQKARRELLGRTIYLVDLSSLMPALVPGAKTPMQAAPGAQPLNIPKIAFTFTDTHLILGSETAVERAVRTSGANAGGAAGWFSKAKSSIPSVVGLAGLQDNAVSGEFLWKMMKDSAAKKDADSSLSLGLSLSPNPGLMLSQAGIDFVDFSLLPDYEKVRKYFGLSAFYGISRPDGLFFELKYLNPD